MKLTQKEFATITASLQVSGHPVLARLFEIKSFTGYDEIFYPIEKHLKKLGLDKLENAMKYGTNMWKVLAAIQYSDLVEVVRKAYNKKKASSTKDLPDLTLEMVVLVIADTMSALASKYKFESSEYEDYAKLHDFWMKLYTANKTKLQKAA